MYRTQKCIGKIIRICATAISDAAKVIIKNRISVLFYSEILLISVFFGVSAFNLVDFV